MDMLIRCLFALFVLIPSLFSSQTIPDSLFRQVSNEEDSIRLKAFVQLTKLYSAYNYDSALFYGKKAIELADETEDLKSKAWALNYTGSTFYYHGESDSAKKYHEKALAIRIQIQDLKGLGASYNNLGNILDDEGNSMLAMEYYQRAQKFFEKIHFSAGMAITYNSLGNLHYNQKGYEKALDYFKKSHNLHTKNGDTLGLIHSINNMAIMYDELMKKDSAMNWYLQSLRLAELMGNTDAILVGYSNLSQLYMHQGDLKKAEEYMRKTLHVNKSYGDTTQLITVYSNLATLHRKKNNLDSALYYSRLSLPIALHVNLLSSAAYNYGFISEVLALQGNFKEAYEYHALFALFTDSILNEENSKQINEMETKFETAKKDKAIIAHNAEIARGEAANKTGAIQRNAIIAGLALLLLIAFFSLRNFRKHKHAHREISLQKIHIEEKQKDILDSIYYARRIQRSLLPNDLFIQQTLQRLKK